MFKKRSNIHSHELMVKQCLEIHSN